METQSVIGNPFTFGGNTVYFSRNPTDRVLTDSHHPNYIGNQVKVYLREHALEQMRRIISAETLSFNEELVPENVRDGLVGSFYHASSLVINNASKKVSVVVQFATASRVDLYLADLLAEKKGRLHSTRQRLYATRAEDITSLFGQNLQGTNATQNRLVRKLVKGSYVKDGLFRIPLYELFSSEQPYSLQMANDVLPELTVLTSDPNGAQIALRGCVMRDNGKGAIVPYWKKYSVKSLVDVKKALKDSSDRSGLILVGPRQGRGRDLNPSRRKLEEITDEVLEKQFSHGRRFSLVELTSIE